MLMAYQSAATCKSVLYQILDINGYIKIDVYGI